MKVTTFGLMTDLDYLDFSSHRVSGTIPTECGALTKLSTRFSLGANRLLTGTLPEWFGLCTGMKEFRVGENSFHGTIPESYGNNWEQIEQAWFQSNSFSGTMPAGFCAINWTGHPGLWADCEKVICSCCTLCCPGLDNC